MALIQGEGAGRPPARGSARTPTPRARLRRAGFADPDRAATLVEELRGSGFDLVGPGGAAGRLDAFGAAADPDAALLSLVRLAETPDAVPFLEEFFADDGGAHHVRCSPGGEPGSLPAGDGGAHSGGGSDDGGGWARLIAVLGGSVALGDHLIRHPEQLARVLPLPSVPTPSPGVAARPVAPLPSVPARDSRASRVLAPNKAPSEPKVMTPEMSAAEGPASDAGGDHPANGGDHPAPGGAPAWDAAPIGRTRAEVRAALLAAVGADPVADQPAASDGGAAAVDALRVAYRARLIEIAAADLAAPDPLAVFPEVGAALADLATGTLEAALAVARARTPGSEKARLAVIAMGKTGGRELNYVSDVDVVYIAAAATGVPEAEGLAVAADLAGALQRICQEPGGEPPIWQVDPNLRPEGKNGPLVRTLDSCRAYYTKWAETWEFQALLKARFAAGDRALGEAFIEMTRPMVWECSASEGFVEAAQAMRLRVERHVKPGEVDREIKLGPGGLRDVEFSIQLLQLVHGRFDETIRSARTLDALEALAAGGYVGRGAARALSRCYRFQRVLEHRVQLRRLRRTHLMPVAAADKHWLARAAHVVPADQAALEEAWRRVRREVRELHLEIFYRPLLPETAKLSEDEARLKPEAARRRLAALGYRDPEGAMRHIEALTQGVSRRAAIQRQLLPVMLGWFAEGADPDAGLLSFRRVSEELGNTPWYLRLLRDSAGAAERLAHVLASSRYVSDGVAREPESVSWFGEEGKLAPRGREELDAEIGALLARHADAATAATAIRAVRRRELVRAGAAFVAGQLDAPALGRAVTVAGEAAVAGALRLARAEAAAGALRGVPAHDAGAAPAEMGIVAMGSFGGRGQTLGSDADVLFVHRPAGAAADSRSRGAEGDVRAEGAGAASGIDSDVYAVAVAGAVVALLGGAGSEPALQIDSDLRPEGRQGPLSRSLDAYREYYERWALAWERQALLRARPLAGDEALLADFMALVDQVRYRPDGVSGQELTELRRLKARVEAERLPRGVEPARHLKLGPGGQLDIQWVAQLLTLRYAGTHAELRVTGTVEALDAAVGLGLLEGADRDVLAEAYVQATAIREANVLWSGRVSKSADVLPHERRTLAGVGRLLGYGPGSHDQLVEDHLRAARRARAVFERVFYG